MAIHVHYTKKAAKAAAAKLRKRGLKATFVGVTNATTGKGMVYHVYTYR
jgi:hypothetical protein